MKKIYVLRSTSDDPTASYHHYYDIGFYTNKKLANAMLKRAMELDQDTMFWIYEVFITPNPF